MSEQTTMMTKKLAKEQLPYWRQMMELRPEDFDIITNCASCLFTLGENEEALKLYKTALELNHSSSSLAMNYAMVLKDLGQFSESATVVHHAFALDQDFFYLRLGWAESLLRNGNWRDAWLLYDGARPVTKEAARNIYGLPNTVRYWHGQKLKVPHNKLLVIGEGGTGDRITYSRWLPKLDELGIEWVYFPDALPPIPGLQTLMARVPWLKKRVGKAGDNPFPMVDGPATHWTTVFSLPAALDAIPTQIPEYPDWFLPDPELKKKYAMNSPDGLPIYGLIWGANELYEGGMKFRSLLESQAMRLVLATADKCHWVNCWAGDAHGTNFRLGHPVFNPKFENWEETAALLSNMDGIVSTDNGACWLAQALGKPVSLLLSSNSDWKFLRNITKSYWHKRTRIFRNNGPNGPEQGFERSIDQCITAIRNGEGVGRILNTYG